jgi:hypothetical protein
MRCQNNKTVSHIKNTATLSRQITVKRLDSNLLHLDDQIGLGLIEQTIAFGAAGTRE